MQCLKCGAQNEPNNNYCQMCGGILEKNIVDANNMGNMNDVNGIDNVNYPNNMNSTNDIKGINNVNNVSNVNVMDNVNYTNNINSMNNMSNTINMNNVNAMNNVSYANNMNNTNSINNDINNYQMPQQTVNYQIPQMKMETPNVNYQQPNQYAVNNNNDDNKKKTNIFMIFSMIVISLIVIFIIVAMLPSSDTLTNVKTYDGEGYSLEYDKDWSITTLSGNKEALKYRNKNSFLVSIGNSALSDAKINFNTTTGKNSLYQTFYNYWNNDSSASNTLKLYSGSNGFNKLTDDIYYATYDYGVSSTNLKGKYILLVSPIKNSVLSFMTNASENVEDNDKNALELLKNIDISDLTSAKEDNTSNDNVIYDTELYNALNSLSNWNRYSSLRSGKLGENKSINGGWRILSSSETYWKFEDGKFWWYKSVNDLNDNYWYGTTKIYTGKEGLTVAGLDESRLDKITSNTSGKVTANDVYTIVLTPTKIISNGIDKSDTNIPAGTTWTYVWILVDHETEGIEAQVLNIGNYNTSYYVKIED